MRPFLTRLAESAGVPVSILSTGRRREDTVFLEPFGSDLGARR